MSVRLSSKTVAPLVIGAFVVGIAISMIAGAWQTESTKVPAQISSGEFEGEYDPGDIRGSYSFDDIYKAFDVPVEDLAAAFGFSDRENPGAIQAKELEDTYGETENGEVGTDSVRYFVALYVGLPYEPENTTLLPGSAVSILRDKISDEQLTDLRLRTVSLADLGAQDVAGTEAIDHEIAEDDTTVRGRTTFAELLNWGLTTEEIEEAMGLEIGKSGVTVRDYLAEHEVEFKDVKDKLQTLIDAQAE